MFNKVRRNDREISKAKAIQILNNAEYGFLGTVGENTFPYVTPLSFIYLNNSIYFHSAKVGHKLENIDFNNKVSFSVVGATKVLENMFSTSYESVVIFGDALEVFNEEKELILLELLNKYAPTNLEKGKIYIAHMKNKTTVIKINIQHLTAKSRS